MERRIEGLPSLTGARFAAAITVVLGHALEGKHVNGWVQPIIGSGTASVCFFYVLSGFILTYNYGIRKNLDFFWFLRARIARVYPVYLLGLALGLVGYKMYQYHWSKEKILGFLANVLCLQDWAPRPEFHAFNSPSWSISCEMFFYAMFPVLIGLFIRNRSNLRLILVVASGIFLLEGLLFGSLVQLIFNHWHSSMIQHSLSYGVVVDQAAYRQPLIRLGEFIIGIAMGAIFLDRPRWNVTRTNVAIVACLAGMLTLMYMPFKQSYETPFHALMFFWIYILIFALLVYGFAQRRHLLSPVLENPVALKLGEASYALYIIHAPMLALLRAAGIRLSISIAIVIATSVVCFEWFEKPMRRLLRPPAKVPQELPVLEATPVI